MLEGKRVGSVDNEVDEEDEKEEEPVIWASMKILDFAFNGFFFKKKTNQAISNLFTEVLFILIFMSLTLDNIYLNLKLNL